MTQPHPNTQSGTSKQRGSRLALKIPPAVYLLVFAGLMTLCDRYFPIATWIVAPWQHAGWLIMGMSLLPAIGAIRLFRSAGTTTHPSHPDKASQLVTHGVYRFTRNPMYLSMLLMLLAGAILFGSVSVLLIPPLFVWTLSTQQIQPEERALAELFGQSYLDYQQRVRRWL